MEYSGVSQYASVVQVCYSNPMNTEEKAIIVDENDTVLEFRERNKVGTFDLHRITAIWIVNDRQEVLLAQRAQTMRNQPGVWGPAAAGTVAAGEEYIETAYRELAEEIGLTGITLVQTGKFMTGKDFGECRICAVFTGSYNKSLESLSLQHEEVAAIRWAKHQDVIDDLITNPNNYVINMSQVIDCL